MTFCNNDFFHIIICQQIISLDVNPTRNVPMKQKTFMHEDKLLRRVNIQPPVTITAGVGLCGALTKLPSTHAFGREQFLGHAVNVTFRKDAGQTATDQRVLSLGILNVIIT